MKPIYLLICLLGTATWCSSQVGIGTNNPHASAKLEIVSTDKGLLTPRMTAAQRTAIGSPATGLLIYQTDGSAGFYYYTGSGWINLAPASIVPAGTIVPFAGTTAPSGWAFCDGGAISRSSYPDLYAAVNTTYGAGNGSTTFNVPDLRGRTVFGKDNMGGSTASRLTSTGGINGTTLGASGGTETRTISTSQLPSHNHSYRDAYFAENHGSDGRVGNNQRYGLSANSDHDNSFYFRTSSDGHTGNGNDANLSTGSTGSGSALPVVNPGIVLNYIIKL